MEPKKLRVYRESQKLVDEVRETSLGIGWYWMRDRMRRAAASIPLNISEGWGRETDGEKRRFLGIAAGSAREVQACLDTVHQSGDLCDARYEFLDDRCDHIARMLGKPRKCLE